MKKALLDLILAAFAFLVGIPADAQESAKVSRIGLLLASSPSATTFYIPAFRKGLAELGYAEGKNIALVYRYAEGRMERLPDLAAELVRLNADVIVSQGIQPSQAAKQATTTIPIVFPGVGDPVAWGLVKSLARPGGNITGFTNFLPELSGKRVELLKEAFPRISRLAVLRDPSQPPQSFNETKAASQSLGLKLQSLEIRNSTDVETAFSAITSERAEAVMTLPQSGINIHRRRILELATKSQLPSTHGDRLWVEAGGIMSYGPDNVDLWRRAAAYVDKILKGAKPADLPVEQPKKFEFAINLKAAKQIGLTIPQWVLVKADKVIQ